MSHLKQRSDKNCLNCNAEVQGRYCHFCGQENIEPFESAWHLITHFFQDITHFDGKFFSTSKYLLFKPGFLSREYMMGRRASYLNPIRMYVFTSAVFFLIFFSVAKTGDDVMNTTVNGKSVEEVQAMDPATFSAFAKEIEEARIISKQDFINYVDTVRGNNSIRFSTGKYRDKEQYDSLIRAGKVDDNWIERKLTYRQFEINRKYQGNQKAIIRSFVETFQHTFPQILFISLPVFALFLKLLYNRNKQYYYGAHAIFGVHLYVFIFIALLFIIAFSKLGESSGWQLFDYLPWLFLILIFLYEYKAMRVFYGQRRGKTILKFIILNLLHLLLNAILIIIFIIFSLMKF